jgi:hypothetical protein
MNMHRTIVVMCLALVSCGSPAPLPSIPGSPGADHLLVRAALAPVNRQVTMAQEGGRAVIRLDERDEPGVVWVEGIEFANGTIVGSGARGDYSALRVLAHRTAGAGAAPATPGELAHLILARFEAGAPEDFADVYPHAEARSLVAEARRQEIPLRAGGASVLRQSRDSAVVFLSGHPSFGSSGDETIYSRMFSGVYRAYADSGVWRLGERIAPDAHNAIRDQALDVTVWPGRGLEVRAALEVEVGSPNGFWAFLNHGAEIGSVTVDGVPAEHVFVGGLLWVRVPESPASRVALEYALDVARDSAASPNSGRFTADFGHVRAQYFWHPFFDFHSARDRSPVRLEAHIPEAYRLATGLPQEERVADGWRIVEAVSPGAVAALTLLYDRDWTPHRVSLGSATLELFLPPSFDPTADSVARAVTRSYRLLAGLFGEPAEGYVAVANGRARGAGGWEFRSNGLVVSSGARAWTSRPNPLPRTWLGHEVAHGWTHPTGPGANTLSEGWATFAEWAILVDEYGEAAVDGFWEHYRNLYDAGGYEGRASLIDDPNNAGVAYNKGAWVFWMLRHVMGEEAFAAGLRSYMAIPRGEPAGFAEFTRHMSAAAGRDLDPFLRPWVEEKNIPDVRARIEEARVVVAQHGPLFTLPLELEVETPSGPRRRALALRQREDTLDTRDLGTVTAVRIDPDRRYLLRRHRGDTLRLALHAPDARRVRVSGDFARDMIDAARTGDVWRVELPVAEGRYVVYGWDVDGRWVRPRDGEVHVVAPARPLVEAASPVESP